ncbi:MAG: DUF2961 domain-containing protein, partial [Planctomycetes bacterium]|nr:DUF2961 domain-containing protein [Planctomycetota bacterium]
MMLRRAVLAFAILLVALAAPAAAAAPDEFAFPALLERLTDLDRLALPPPAGVKHVQFSSYDRRSDRGPEDPEAWFANGDSGKFLRIEESAHGKEHVMAEADGPGLLVRLWSADPKGVLRIYLDREEKPLLQCPAPELLDGKHPLFPPPLAGVRSHGHNLYVPIPFAKHLKVTCSTGGFYYHVNVLSYPAGTPIQSLTEWELAKAADRIHEAARRLEEQSGLPREEKRMPWMYFRVDAGATQTIMKVEHDGERTAAIRDFVLGGLEAEDLAAALRQVLIAMTFDGTETVRVPLGEFFGSGPRAGSYRGLAMGAVPAEEGPLFYCRFPLPFARSAAVTLENRTGKTFAAKFHARLDSAALQAEAMHFHAVYREGVDLATRPFTDVNWLDVTGTGQVVGCVLTVLNPVKNWWGEGDEKITVDGEAFPSIFGTGTEDYFGYAWCCPEPFSHPYHAQPTCDGPGNYGLTTVNRFHLLDPIPFHRSVRFDMELWHWKDVKVDYATTVFFYAKAGARDRAPYPAGRTPHLRLPSPYVAPRVAGALEGEALRFEARSGTAVVQE